MWKLVPKVRLNPPLLRKLSMLLVLAAATVSAFYWGRTGALQATAQQTHVPAPVDHGAKNSAANGDYQRRVVAYLYDNMPVTREDLGEYLIARLGAERVEFLVNRKIVEVACQSKGIHVTDAEIEAQLADDLRGFGNMSLKDFNNQVLKRFNKNLYEWKEDVIRPKLLLAKMCRPLVEVKYDDLVKAFEARYGPKVKCRMIVLTKDDNRRFQKWETVRDNENEFRELARNQFIQALAAKGGEVPPIHRHFPDPEIEKEAFSLQPGQISPLKQLKDGTFVIIKCDEHIAADKSKKLDDERINLHKELAEVKLAQKIPEVFDGLRKQANPRILISPQVRQEDLERAVVRDIAPPGASAPKAGAPMGN